MNSLSERSRFALLRCMGAFSVAAGAVISHAALGAPLSPQSAPRIVVTQNTAVKPILQKISDDRNTIIVVDAAAVDSAKEQVPAGEYETGDLFRAIQHRLNMKDYTASASYVTFIPSGVATPTLNEVATVAAHAIEDLADVNQLLSSLSPAQIRQCQEGKDPIAVNDLSPEIRKKLMARVKSVAAGARVNDRSVADLADDTANWNLKINFFVLIYLTSPDGTFNQASVSRTDRSQTYHLDHVAATPDAPPPAPGDAPKDQVLAAPVFADQKSDVEVPLSSNPENAYTLGELAKLASANLQHTITVDRRVASRRLLILAPHHTISSSLLLRTMGLATSLNWRMVGPDTAFLTQYPQSLETSAKKQAVNLATEQNKDVLAFVFQNFPAYVDGLSPGEFLRLKSRWKSLPIQEQQVLRQIIPFSPEYSTNSRLSQMLKPDSDISDVLVQYNLVTCYTVSYKTDYSAYIIHNLVTSGDVAEP